MSDIKNEIATVREFELALTFRTPIPTSWAIQQYSSLITTIESLQGELKAADDHEETLKHAFHVRQNINEKELYDKNKIIESQKEEIEKLQAIIHESVLAGFREQTDKAKVDTDTLKEIRAELTKMANYKAITELVVESLRDIVQIVPIGSAIFDMAVLTLSEIERLSHE